MENVPVNSSMVHLTHLYLGSLGSRAMPKSPTKGRTRAAAIRYSRLFCHRRVMNAVNKMDENVNAGRVSRQL